ncbi:MAG: DUF3127 domain-containing protein [Bacteroidales bacterium]|nr:DUF3127 domain-containing protein [Bacteroidales bacterium]
MSYELQGKLIEKHNTIQVSDKFKKREFIVETREENNGREFIETIKFQLIQDRCDLINSYNLGDEIKVYFNIKGNRWEKDGRVNYFTNLDVWKVETIKPENPDEQMATGEAGKGQPPMPDQNELPPLDHAPEDDLPF